MCRYHFLRSGFLFLQKSSKTTSSRQLCDVSVPLLRVSFLSSKIRDTSSETSAMLSVHYLRSELFILQRVRRHFRNMACCRTLLRSAFFYLKRVEDTSSRQLVDVSYHYLAVSFYSCKEFEDFLNNSGMFR
ncbi:hypothetical protein JTE90_003473 [Oedothorax gibbosus]|uniref:Uncharacterized protein n=1 Tax=Oedothorax gibbosus TaxID=931172 RepID=A0AAV6TRQ0_9ARAC|nr:hypothetical protein JTE90_003473 [Oedothorax gibbosus]